MPEQMPLTAAATELSHALFQACITAGLALFALALHKKLHERWVLWWAAAWGLYVLRLSAMITFLATGNLIWLFWHQVATGWAALAILWAALIFSRQLVWRPWYLLFALFPAMWGWVAVNGLANIKLAALPMVLFLAGATLWTGWVFWRYASVAKSGGARFVAVALFLWGLHHLDYPWLRAQGTWVPWGYYLDIFFELAVGIGFGLIALSDFATRLTLRTDELGRLSALMVRQQEAERRRLSQDLHDETAQTLSAVKLEIGMLREGADDVEQERLDHVLALVDGGIREIRRVINDLRPALLDDLGLTPAIHSLATDVRERGRLDVRTDLPETMPRLAPEVELALFRATQEALANVVRHADASEVIVRLRSDGPRLVLTIADNGRGLPAENRADASAHDHLGLAGMRERIGALGGIVVISTGRTGGVSVRVDVPVVEIRG